MKHVLVIFTLLYCASLHATECTTRFEYRVVQTNQQDGLIATGASRASAGTKLETILNRWGSKGWDLVSAPDLMVRTQEIGNKQISVAQFKSGAMLLKRRMSTCQLQ